MNAAPFTVAMEARVIGALLAAAVLLGMARLLLRHRRGAQALRAHPARLAVLLLAQPVGAALLYFALLPPMRPSPPGTLVVATADTPRGAWKAAGGGRRIALPEAPTLPGAERAPDLATALRRHPGIHRLHVLGAGLAPRDVDAARDLAVTFDPAPLPVGLVALDAPRDAVAGASFPVAGRVHGLPRGSVELWDPGRQRIDRVAVGADGRFLVTGMTRVPGTASFELRVLDARGRRIQTVALPLQVEAAVPPSLLVLAGAPGPEVKFLRRWARDAGLPLQSQIDAGGGLQLGDAPIAITADTLARFDVVVLDERAWSSLGDGGRAALVQALRSGLGVVLRITAPLSEVERRRLRGLGFVVDAGRDSESLRLLPPSRDEAAVRARLGPGTRDAPRDGDAPLPEVPMLTSRRLATATGDGVVLRSTLAGATAGTWRAEGRGRIALWTLADTHRLVLAGRDDLHGALWSEAVATVARPRTRPTLSIEGEARQDVRLSVCGLGASARVVDPSGDGTRLLPDPRTGARRCAAFWPTRAGWHVVSDGSRLMPFHVRATPEARGLQAAAMRDATLRLQAASSDVSRATAGEGSGTRGARWPWWLAWLLVASATWWFERSRWGRTRGSG